MKLSARNMIKGRVVDVTRGTTTAHVRIDVGGGTVITASITNEAVDDLKLTRGDTAPHCALLHAGYEPICRVIPSQHGAVPAKLRSWRDFRSTHPSKF